MKTILSFIFFSFGLAIGLFIENLPFLTFKKEVGVGEIANFLIALTIAILIPLLLHTWIDNKRFIKDYLIEEIKACLVTLTKIKEIVDDCYSNDSTSDKDKGRIVYLFSEVDRQINTFCEEMKHNFKKESKDIINIIKEANITYWKETTGGPLMNQQFKINYNFYNKHNSSFYKNEVVIKKCISKINSL